MNFGAIFNLFKRYPGWTTLGAGSIGLGGIKAMSESGDDQKQSSPTSTQQTSAQQQASAQSQQQASAQSKQQASAQSKQQASAQSKQQASAQSKQSQEPPQLLPPPPPNGDVGSSSGVNAPAPVEDDNIKELQKQFYGLFAELDKYRKEYDTVVDKHMQVNDLYEKQLLASMSTMSLLLSKTPLNNMTNEDLIHHATNLFTSMPYGNALENFSKLTKGYYLAKMNNVNPSELSMTDLIAIADNPVLAKSADENLAGYLEQIGEVLKLKMKSNLDEVGKLKDAFSEYKKELDEKGKLLKDLIDLEKVKYTLGINQFKAETQAEHYKTEEDIQKEKNALKSQHDRATEDLRKQALGLKEKEMEQKKQLAEQKANKKEKSDNGNTPSF
jgi:hypothetical protein